MLRTTFLSGKNNDAQTQSEQMKRTCLLNPSFAGDRCIISPETTEIQITEKKNPAAALIQVPIATAVFANIMILILKSSVTENTRAIA